MEKIIGQSELSGGGGGGAPPLLKVIGTCRWTGYDFADHEYWHRGSNRPNVVITIDTSRVSKSVFLAMADYFVYHRVTYP